MMEYRPLHQTLRVNKTKSELKADLLDYGGLSFGNNMVTFTKYNDEAVESGRFGGCYMAAFKFIQDPALVSDSVSIVSRSAFPPFRFEEGETYVAHIFTNGKTNEVKFKFADLENSGIIKIEALFRPYDTFRDKRHLRELWKKSYDPTARGILKKGRNGWKAWVQMRSVINVEGNYYRNINVSDAQEIDERALMVETYYYKGLFRIDIDSEELNSLDQIYKDAYAMGKRDQEL